MNTNKSQFFGMLLHASIYFKLAHFDASGSGGYAAHLTYEELKNKLDELSDELIECEQGENGLYEIVVPTTKLQKTPFEFILALLEYIRGTRKIFEYGYQQSLIDEMEQVLAKSMYKLKFLK